MKPKLLPWLDILFLTFFLDCKLFQGWVLYELGGKLFTEDLNIQEAGAAHEHGF